MRRGIIASCVLCAALSFTLIAPCTVAIASQSSKTSIPGPKVVKDAQRAWQKIDGTTKPKSKGIWLDVEEFGPRTGANTLSPYMLDILEHGLGEYDLSNKLFYRTSGDAELDDIVHFVVSHVTGRGSDALRRAYEFVSKYEYAYRNTNHAGKWSTWSVTYAKEMFNRGMGNCYRYASLMCWLARELGYDASVVAGEVYQSPSAGYQPHAWCEVDINGTRYIIDSDMHAFIRSRNFFLITAENAPVKYKYPKKA